MKNKTNPELFIIESLSLEDEKEKRHEGEIVSKMLNLSGKSDTAYYYIRTKKELIEIVKIFGKSKHRYLHISCHGNDSFMSTTFDDISFSELGDILRPYLDKKRVFVSACEMANRKLAKELLPNTECLSLIGPSEEIAFDNAAAFWVSFYHLMFKRNENSMKNKSLQNCIIDLAELFEEPINFYLKKPTAEQGFAKIRSKKI
ncbi:hypothetical protein [Photobacterium sanguinicancri]|uniref:hypothetical protein n=1 Tax=Photobacterium sanguinicancri TaxID=875932 RepID=UPI0026E17424|nr:hypothetical protein [Photobacterium sanguinicancri]MDO6497024.1 hypothetical protein [Photobacterium sanguinicancri]